MIQLTLTCYYFISRHVGNFLIIHIPHDSLLSSGSNLLLDLWYLDELDRVEFYFNSPTWNITKECYLSIYVMPLAKSHKKLLPFSVTSMITLNSSCSFSNQHSYIFSYHNINSIIHYSILASWWLSHLYLHVPQQDL